MADIIKKYGLKKSDFNKDKKLSITERYGLKKEDFLPKEQTGLESMGIDKNNIFADANKFLNSARRNLATGVSELGRGLANSPHNLANVVGLGDYVANLSDPNFDFAKFYGAEENPDWRQKAMRMAPEIAASFALPGANLGRAGQAISSIPKVGKFLGEAASQAAPQALFGATQNQNPLEGAAQGGLGSLAGSAVGSAIGKGINALRPSQRINTPLSKKELARAYQQTKGTNTDLGNVIENPALQRAYENKLSKQTPKVYEIQQKTAQQVTDKGANIMKKLLGKHSPENVPDTIAKHLNEDFKKHQKFKNDIYNAVDDLAKKEDLKLTLPKFASEAKKYMAAIEDTNMLKHEPDAKQILNKLIHYEKPVKETTKTGLLVDKQGKPLLNETKMEHPSLKEANILKGKLASYAKSFAQSPDASQRNMAKIFNNLSKSLKGDIRQSIESSGSDVLKKGYNTAEENYAKNFSPFLDKDIYKFIGGNADPEKIIQKFVQTSRSTDLAGKLGRLQHIQRKDSPLAYGYLAKAIDQEGKLNPQKMATAINNLGKNQLKTLFPDKAVRKEVLNYKALVHKNKDALNAMFNPKTGQRSGDIVPHSLQNILGSIGGFAAHGTPGALIGTFALPAAISQASKMAAKKLTDEGFRRKMINALVANKKFTLPKTTKGLSTAGAVSQEKHKPMELELRKGR